MCFLLGESQEKRVMDGSMAITPTSNLIFFFFLFGGGGLECMGKGEGWGEVGLLYKNEELSI